MLSPKNALTESISSKDITLFRKPILIWFNRNKRNYPWRETLDPFKVLIAEMMLRRTNADQVRPVYERLFTEYPDIHYFIEADTKSIEHILYPLGLKQRAANFINVAKEIAEHYGGKIPNTREELKNLHGVGDYIAGAVLSLAYKKGEWMVDSNAIRLFKRYFGIRVSKQSHEHKKIIELAKLYVSTKNSRKANLAMLDFSALVCRPRNPQCDICSLRERCYYVHYEY